MPISLFTANMKSKCFILILGFFCLNHPAFANHPSAALAQAVRTELYFGAIPILQWNQFLAQIVTPLFPDGLTWFNVAGQWKGPNGQLQKEPSRMLIILYADTRQNDQAIEKIRRQFKRRFHQQAVLRVSLRVKAEDLTTFAYPTSVPGVYAHRWEWFGLEFRSSML
jgi:hypothetical protein